MTSEQTESPAGVWYRNRRNGIIAAGVVLLLALVLVSLPYGIQYGLSDFLKQHGASQVRIQNIDFNPFTGRLLFEGVTAVADHQPPLRLTRLELVLGWRDLFSKHARVEAVDLQGLAAEVDLTDPARLRVNGLSFPLAATMAPAEPPAEERPWGFALDRVELRQCVFTLRRADLAVDLELERLSLQRVISWRLQEVADLTLGAKLNGAPLSAELRASLFDVSRKIEGEIDLQGFDLKPLQSFLSAAGAPRVAGSLSLQQAFRITLSPGSEVSWESDGLLQGGDLQVVDARIEARDRLSSWQGKTAGSWSGRAGLNLQLQGELRLEGLELLRHRLRADLALLRWQGELSLAPGEAAPELSATGEGGLEGLRLAEQEPLVPLASLQRLDLAGVSLSSDHRLSLAGVSLQGVRLEPAAGAKTEPLLQTQALSLENVRFAASSGLAVGRVEQQGMQARLALDKSGRLNLMGLAERLQRAAMPDAAGAAGSKRETAATEPLPVKIDRLVWQGKNQASFVDNSVTPPFQLALDVQRFTLNDIDSSRPERPSPFSFTGSTGRHAEIRAEGEITLFQSDPTGRLQGRLRGVELLPLSSYTVPAIGYHLDSGELDAEVELALKQGMVEGNNHLIIRRLEVSQASAAEAAKLEQQIAMPLDTALGMLQDKHQTIDLNLPISGKLSDPNVELGDVINTALGNALKKGAMTYLTTALFPYGTMVALLKMAGEEAAAVRLNPVEFEPAAVQLDERDRDYLDKVAQVLKERPKIAVRLCGAATQTDRQALVQAMAARAEAESPAEEPSAEAAAEEPPLQQVPEAELLALAKQRAEVIEDYLVQRHGISPGRTAVCRPQLDPDEGAVPRVDLQI